MARKTYRYAHLFHLEENEGRLHSSTGYGSCASGDRARAMHGTSQYNYACSMHKGNHWRAAWAREDLLHPAQTMFIKERSMDLSVLSLMNVLETAKEV